jgi:hypothetical protein
MTSGLERLGWRRFSTTPNTNIQAPNADSGHGAEGGTPATDA